LDWWTALLVRHCVAPQPVPTVNMLFVTGIPLWTYVNLMTVVLLPLGALNT
jgi:hypothetical protein